jgi:hypothetical protein
MMLIQIRRLLLLRWDFMGCVRFMVCCFMDNGHGDMADFTAFIFLIAVSIIVSTL